MDWTEIFGWPLPSERVKRLDELCRRYARIQARLEEIQEAKKNRRPHLRLIRFDKQKAPSEKSNNVEYTLPETLECQRLEELNRLRWQSTTGPSPLDSYHTSEKSRTKNEEED